MGIEQLFICEKPSQACDLNKSNKYKKHQQEVLSVSWIQTPTLKLMVNRDRAIEHFKPKNYFELVVQFTTNNNASFVAKWQPFIATKRIIDSDVGCVIKSIGKINKENKKMN